MSTRTTLPLDQIRVGKRHRKDLGDISALAESIEDIGLLHPITVDQDGRLLAGARRLAAYKHLGRKEIPVNIVRAR
jgi:ParB family chromosome partitioning protein